MDDSDARLSKKLSSSLIELVNAVDGNMRSVWDKQEDTLKSIVSARNHMTETNDQVHALAAKMEQIQQYTIRAQHLSQDMQCVRETLDKLLQRASSLQERRMQLDIARVEQSLRENKDITAKESS